MRFLQQITEIACLKLEDKEDQLEQAYGKLDQLLAEQAPEGESRFARMVNEAPDQDLFLSLLEFCVARSWSTEAGKWFPTGVSLELAARYSETSPHTMGQLRDFYRYVCRFFIPPNSACPFFQHAFQADERLLGYLCGDDAIDPMLAQAGARLITDNPPAHPLFARQSALKQLDVIFSREPVPMVQLAGEIGSGRTFLLHHCCYTGKKNLLLIDYRRLVHKEEKEARQLGRAVAREAMLSSAHVCYANISKESCPDEAALLRFQEQYLNPLWGMALGICITTDMDTDLIPFFEGYVEKLTLLEPNRGERIALWKGFGCLYKMEHQLDCQSAGAKFRLTPRQISRAVQRLASRTGNGPMGDREVADACAQVLPPPRQGSIRLVSTPYTLEDIKVPSEVKQKLKSLCAHVRYSRLVYDEWGMESRYAYGKNVSALLVGPPGTGKTMAAHVLSNELNIPLYRIDLSQVVDKYIGETEKRLEEIFQSAERSNTILFFDEADAIFGKRSEVNDAHDKYANTEVSYILQRIEQYDGIVILATNYKKNIDEAFMRRMRYLVEFSMPAKEERLAIWQGAFSPKTPLEQVDFAYLARQFELSGGSIKNIVINAVFLAAEQGTAVNMGHILESLRNENLKIGKPMLSQDFAEYARLYQEHLAYTRQEE